MGVRVPAVRAVRDLQGPDKAQVAVRQDALPGLPGAEPFERLRLHPQLVSQRLAGPMRVRESHHDDLVLVRVRPLERLGNLDPPALADLGRARRAARLGTDHQAAVEGVTVLLGAMDMHCPVKRRVQALGRLVVVPGVLEAQRRTTSQQQLPGVALELIAVSTGLRTLRRRPLGGLREGGGRGFGVGTKGSAFGLAGAAARRTQKLPWKPLERLRIAQLSAYLMERITGLECHLPAPGRAGRT